MDTSNAYPNNKHLNVLVVIPAYNEQESIVSVVNDVVSAGYDYVVVNDGSTDETQSLCESHGFNVLNLPQNLGIGGCGQAGAKYGLKLSTRSSTATTLTSSSMATANTMPAAFPVSSS